MNAAAQYQYQYGESVADGAGQLPLTGGPNLLGIVATIAIIMAIVIVANLYLRRIR